MQENSIQIKSMSSKTFLIIKIFLFIIVITIIIQLTMIQYGGRLLNTVELSYN